MKEKIIEKLKEVKDPEIGLDIYSLGLVYGIDQDEDGVVITMTLTSPFCPFADKIIQAVETEVSHIAELEGKDVRVEITFDPPWEPSEDLRVSLGI